MPRHCLIDKKATKMPSKYGGTFGFDIDYAQSVKQYGKRDRKHVGIWLHWTTKLKYENVYEPIYMS